MKTKTHTTIGRRSTIGLVLLASLSLSRAAIVELYPVFVRSGADTNLDGTFETIFDADAQYIYADVGLAGSGRRNTALEFDIPSISRLDCATLITGSFPPTPTPIVPTNGAVQFFGYTGNGTFERTDLTNGQYVVEFRCCAERNCLPFCGDVTAAARAQIETHERYMGFRCSALDCEPCGGVFSTNSFALLRLNGAFHPRITRLTFVPPDSRDLVLSFQGYDGDVYAIDSSTDLMNWQELPVGDISTGSTTGQVFDVMLPDAGPGATSDASVFFRIRVRFTGP